MSTPPEPVQTEGREPPGASGIEESLVCDLQRAGFPSDMIHLLYLVPFIAMAWAEGVSRREREQMLASLELRGMPDDSAEYQQLARWLTEPPSEEFYAAAFRAIRAILANLTPPEQERARRSVLDTCITLAHVTGGLHGAR